MATKVFRTMVCDGCGTEGTPTTPVVAHTVKVDTRKARQVDACEDCWAKATDSLMTLLDKGIPVGGQRRTVTP